jgi:hypothetical protein
MGRDLSAGHGCLQNRDVENVILGLELLKRKGCTTKKRDDPLALKKHPQPDIRLLSPPATLALGHKYFVCPRVHTTHEFVFDHAPRED